MEDKNQEVEWAIREVGLVPVEGLEEVMVTYVEEVEVVYSIRKNQKFEEILKL